MRSLPILLLAASTVLLRAADPDAFAVPTFESLGLYYNRPEAKTPCTVSYRVCGCAAVAPGLSAGVRRPRASVSRLAGAAADGHSIRDQARGRRRYGDDRSTHVERGLPGRQDNV